jgi:hypothetical protein
MGPKDAISKPSTPFSVACEPAAPNAGGPGLAPEDSPAAPAAANARPTHALDTSTDSVALDFINPRPGTYLKRGQPVTFNIDVSYNLASADSAILSISTAQLRTSAAGCRGGGGELVDAVEVPIVHGTHQAQARLTWSGDTVSATGGRIYGNGYLLTDVLGQQQCRARRAARLLWHLFRRLLSIRPVNLRNVVTGRPNNGQHLKSSVIDDFVLVSRDPAS